MKMLEKFKSRLEKSNREAILFDRKPKVVPEDVKKSTENVSDRLAGDGGETSSNLEESGRLDLDAEDVEGDEWLVFR